MLFQCSSLSFGKVVKVASHETEKRRPHMSLQETLSSKVEEEDSSGSGLDTNRPDER